MRPKSKIITFGLFQRFGILLSALLLTACGSGGDGAPPAATFSLQGTFSPPEYSAVDGDVNDPQAAYVSNDSFDQAQELVNPVILAGYLNLAFRGPLGRSFSVGDSEDFYRVNLSAGDAILLATTQPEAADLDLYLYRASDASLVDAALGPAAGEVLTAPDSDEFIVAVRIRSGDPAMLGASTYNLIIGADADLAGATSPRLSQAFVPGEVIVHYAQPASVSESLQQLSGGTSNFAMTPMGGGHSREWRLVFAAGRQTRAVLAALNRDVSSEARRLNRTVSAEMQHKLDTLEIIKALNQRHDVQVAAPNYIREPHRIPDDDYFGLQWHHNLIRLPDAWEITTGDDDVVVAVVDTGVLIDHPDIRDRLTTDGYDFISDAAIEGNEPADEIGGIDPNPDDPGDLSPGGSSFHGTHVAGTIAAATDNTIGVAGAAWRAARIMPLRAVGVGGGTSYDIIQAVRYAAGLPNDSGTVPDRPADIINLSLGGGGESDVERALFESISAKGLIVVAAAGNEASRQKSFPAAYDSVISVTAVDYVANRAYYANFGETIDVAAPGGDNTVDLNGDGYPDGVLSTVGNDRGETIEMVYSFNQGTSMAAPHVAGVAALMKSVWPEMTYTDFIALLKSGALTSDLGEPGRDDDYGYGLIDAQKAVLAAGGGTVPAMISVRPAAFGFGGTLTRTRLKVEALGDPAPPLTVSVASDAEWLAVAPDEIDADGLGTYAVTVDRTDLAEGVYDGTVTFSSSVNSVDVPISMRVGRTDRTVDAGVHYVVLVDPETQENRAQVETAIVGGIYAFSFENVAAGEYLLYAGTDLNNDFVIGDAGESLGAYLSIDRPIVLSIDQDRADLDFKTEFNINLSNAGKVEGLPASHLLRNIEERRIEE